MTVEHHKLIQTIETLSFKALPALETRHYDGWLLRYANGYTRRANSVNPVYHSTEDIDLKMSYCESLYADKQRPTVYKMTDAVYPPNLDALLDKKGYHKEAETYVYTLSLIGQGNPSNRIRIDTQLSQTWVDNFTRLNNISAQNSTTLHQMLALIPVTCGFVSLVDEDDVVGVALGVVDGEWMGIFDVVVDPSQRGKGYGRMIMEALIDWGMIQGAETGYLQVQADNTVATTLYRALGFKHRYAYWYRVKPLG